MSLTKEQMIKLYRNLIRAHEYDTTMYRRMMSGKLIGFYHPGEGAMAPGVAAHTIMRDGDYTFPHHRAHGMAAIVSREMDIKRYLAEHTGKQGGCCEGRSSFHGSFPEKGLFMYSGFIGAQFSPAVGWGWAAKRNGRGQISFCGAGDGGFGQGRAHEAMLMSQNWKLPVIFWCENNGLAIYGDAAEMHPTEDISSLAQGYGMPAMVIDGQDLFACAEAAVAAFEHAREGKGPVFVELKTCRYHEHDIGTPDLRGDVKRSEEEIAELRDRDPVLLATKRVLDEGVLSQEEIDQIKAEAKQEVEDNWAWADEQPIAQPTEEELMAAVFAP